MTHRLGEFADVSADGETAVERRCAQGVPVVILDVDTKEALPRRRLAFPRRTLPPLRRPTRDLARIERLDFDADQKSAASRSAPGTKWL